MPAFYGLRSAAALLGLAALAACASEPQSATRAGTSAPAAQLNTAYVTPERRQRLSRETQLQTPVELSPQATGAPEPNFYAAGSDVGAPELLAAGADISPDIRVWQRWPAGTRQIYGPKPGRLNPILTPVVIAPE